MDQFEKTFRTITSIIFGKELTGYKDYGQWLSHDVSEMEKVKSALSEDVVYLPKQFQFYQDVQSRIITFNEAYDVHGKKQLDESRLNLLSLKNAGKTLKDISLTTMDTFYGQNSNLVECSLYYNSHSCYQGIALVSSKCCLYSFWPRQSEYMIGCYYCFSCSFSIKCYNSENLTRCFEVSDSTNCTDSYFCYNCENLSNCMFCFNTKSKRYAIANVEVGREKYIEIKKKFLGELLKTLERDKKLDISIFHLY